MSFSEMLIIILLNILYLEDFVLYVMCYTLNTISFCDFLMSCVTSSDHTLNFWRKIYFITEQFIWLYTFLKIHFTTFPCIMSSVIFFFFFAKCWYDKLLIFIVFVPVIWARTHYLLHVININTLTIIKLLNNSQIITVV